MSLAAAAYADLNATLEASKGSAAMRIRIGFELVYDCPRQTPMLLMLNVHYTRAADLLAPDVIIADPPVPIRGYRDDFGNWCSRLVAPAGRLRLRVDALVSDSGAPDILVADAIQQPVDRLPEATLPYLLGSRYCETDKLADLAWSLFGSTQPGWARVQAICDFVHDRIVFGYGHARNTRTAFEAYGERLGVCRDFTHLAVAFCRCMNIPARYCTGYLGDIGVPDTGIGDFSAWFEAYLGDRWYTFDPRNNRPRIGRVLMAYGRDAADVALSTTFGPNVLTGFKVWTDQIVESATA